MQSCPTNQQLQTYAAGGLSETERAALELHLRACPRCAAIVANNPVTVMTSPKTIVDSAAPPKSASKTVADTRAEMTSAYEVPQSSPGSASHWSELTTPSQAPLTVVSVDQFLSSLSESGLLSQADLAAIQKPSGESAPSTVQSLADILVKAGKLTPYQAQALARGQGRGLVLGNYVILAKLGEGGMGAVFKARHRRMNRTVALKVLPPSVTKVPEALARFQREVELAAKLQHENIAVAYDADEAEGVHFLVMEIVEGPNLAAYVKEKGPLPVAAAVGLMAQAARGLALAHGLHIVHRDIKPSNLMVNREGKLKILDMGLARIRSENDTQADVTRTGNVMGTVDYMAPEQAIDAKNVDYRADQYSLGCTLYFLLTGQAVAPAGSMAEKLLWHQSRQIAPLTDRIPGVTPRVDQILAKMLAKRPADRYESSSDLADDLESCLAELPRDEKGLQFDGIQVATDSKSTIHGTRVASRTANNIAAAATIISPALLGGAGPIALQPAGFKGWLIGGGVAVAVVALLGAWAAFGGGKKPSPEKEVVKTPVPNLPPKANEEKQPEKTEVVAVKPVAPPVEKTIVTPSPLVSQQDKLLKWVSQNGGKATLRTGEGKEVIVTSLDQIPPGQSLDTLAIHLDAAGVKNDELAQLAVVPGLRELTLADTKISDAGLVHLDKLPNLARLDLSKTDITNDGLKQIKRLSQLTELNLRGTKVTNQGLSQLVSLAKLQSLYLSDTSVSDVGLAQLKPLKNLKLLAVNGTELSEQGHADMKAALPGLEISWDGADPQRALALKLLEKGATLTLADRTGQTHTGLQNRDDLPLGRVQVKAVDFSTSRAAADDDLKQLGVLPELETVNISSTKVTAAGLDHLKGVSTLKSLDLGAMRVSAAALAKLQEALPGCKITQREPADAQVAKWVIAQHGKVTVANEKGIVSEGVQQVEKLPAAAFVVRGVVLDDAAAVDDTALAQLAQLSSLETLLLNGTSVGDEGLLHLTACKGLKELGLSGTRITAAALPILAKLPALERLYLARTNIGSAGVKGASALTGLTHLSLQGVKIADDDLVLLKRLDRLELLDVAATPLTDAATPNLAQLKKLKKLNVSDTKFTDAGQEELRLALAASKCEVLGAPLDPQRKAARWVLQVGGVVTIAGGGEVKKAAELPRTACRITKLDLAELKNLNAKDFSKQVAGLADLQELNLAQVELGDRDLEVLRKLPALKKLLLTNVPITDRLLPALGEMSQLEELDLSGTRVKGIGLESLIGAAKLRILRLGNTRLEEESLATLAKFTALQLLDVASSTAVNDETAAPFLKAMPHLTTLILRGTKITDASLDAVAKLAELRELDLGRTQVTDSGAGRLASLKRLEVLSLSKTGITDGGLSPLAQMKQLKRVDLTFNKLNEGSIRSLQDALPNCAIAAPSARNADPNNPLTPDGQSAGGRLSRP